MSPIKSNKQNQTTGNFAFIDSQNLNLGTQKVGWKMDWRKFRQWLSSKYNITKAYMFIGYVPEFEEMYEQLHESGYLIVLKPTQDMSRVQAENVEVKAEKPEDKKPIKGNIDADLVLWAMKEINNYNKAIIVSGDGDFHGLFEYLMGQDKLMHIMTPNWQYSQLLKPFDTQIVRLDKHRSELEYRSKNRNAKQHSR
jgi:uncharacterized LabA/DUF88 family protein